MSGSRLEKDRDQETLLSNGSHKNYSENSRNLATRAVYHKPKIITKQQLSLAKSKTAPNSNLCFEIMLLLGY